MCRCVLADATVRCLQIIDVLHPGRPNVPKVSWAARNGPTPSPRTAAQTICHGTLALRRGCAAPTAGKRLVPTAVSVLHRIVAALKPSDPQCHMRTQSS